MIKKCKNLTSGQSCDVTKIQLVVFQRRTTVNAAVTTFVEGLYNEKVLADSHVTEGGFEGVTL